MAAVIGALRAELSAGIAQFVKDMGAGADSVKAFGKTAKEVASDMESTGRTMSLAITAPFLLLSKGALDQAKLMRDAQGQVAAALASTGSASGKTQDQLEGLAKQLSSVSTFGKNDILRNVSANLLTFGNITGKVFDQAQVAIVNMAAKMGGGEGSLQDATLKIGRALNDPIQGVNALSRAGIQFTTAQKDQIKTLVQSGNGYKAQLIILDALTKKYAGAAAAARAAAPDAAAQQDWENFEETIGNIEIKLLPALTDELKSVLGWFQSLNTETQTSIVKWTAIAAAVGPVLIVFSKTVTAVKSLVEIGAGLSKALGLWELSFVALAAELLIVGAAVGVLAAEIYASTQISQSATDAINSQTTAHQFLKDAMDKAAASGRDMTMEEKDAAAQKLKLAQNTLQAALAQERQNLAQDEAATSSFAKSVKHDVQALVTGQTPPDIRVVQEQNAINQLQGQLTANLHDQGTLFGASSAGAGARAGSSTGGFDLHNEDQIKKAADALETLEKNLTDVQQRIATGLEAVDMPKSITSAKELNDQLTNYLTTAQQAGVNTSAFAGTVQGLRDKIEQLKQAELAKEAVKFSQEVDKDAIAVQEFAKGGLPALQEKLQAVDDQYDSLRDKITASIKENEGLANANDAARASMVRLQGQLVTLETAHAAARAAAVAQAAAEQKLADLTTQSTNLETSNQIRDFRASAGTGSAPISSTQKAMQDATDALAAQQIKTQQDLLKLETDRDLLVTQNQNGENDKQIANLNSEITLQQELANLVNSTTAVQIDTATRVNEAFKTFTDNLSTTISDMIANWTFDLKGLKSVFAQLAESLFIKPEISSLTDQLGSWIKGIGSSFTGAHAAGGYIPPHKWGTVGEKGPELAFGGNSGATIYPNGSGGTTQIFNISTPDANSFRASRRQVGRAARKSMGFVT